MAGRARLGEARGERTGQAATNAILYGSCDAQPVQVTIGVQGGWIQATIRDQGRPGMLVPLRQCISLGDSAGSAGCAMVG